MTKIMSLDFETKDPYINRKMGPGWPYAYHKYQGNDFEVLCAAISDGDNTYYFNQDNINELAEHIRQADIVVAHNLQYELGCLMALGHEDLVKSMYGKSVDTLLVAKLYDSSLMSYSLDALCSKYLGLNKQHDELVQECWDSHIYPLTKIELNKIAKDPKWIRPVIKDTVKSKVKNWVYSNLDKVQEKDESIIKRYVCSDTELCRKLFMRLFSLGTRIYDNFMDRILHTCKLQHICVDYTRRGIRVDMNKIDEGMEKLQPMIVSLMQEIQEEAGQEFNVNASAQLAKIFQDMGLKTGTTASGNPSVTKDILEKENHRIAGLVRKYKEYNKVMNDYLGKIRDICSYTRKEGEDPLTRRYGRVHPHFGPMNARTGRFSCQGPNAQQIPKRNKEIGPMTRGIFCAEEGQKWYSEDFSNQEGRLQIHFASSYGVTGYVELVEEFKKNPKHDLHQVVADSLNISRGQAKTINLGMSYGMGGAKLCESLGLPTDTYYNKKYRKQLTCAGEEGKRIIEDFHELYPFLKELTEIAQEETKSTGYVTTVTGRKIATDKITKNGKDIQFPHKAFNQLIQGSAYDQTAECMIAAYEAGLPVMLTVHDELCMSGTKEQSAHLKEIMENTVKLDIPSVTDVEEGYDWFDCTLSEDDERRRKQ